MGTRNIEPGDCHGDREQDPQHSFGQGGETSMEVWGAQPPVLASGSCGFMSLVSCAKSMARTIAKCIKRGVRGLESCVKDFIGSGNRCYPCVCSVLSFIDNGYDCGVSSLTGQAVQGGGHLGWCLIFCRG